MVEVLTAAVLASPVLCNPMTTHMPWLLTASSASAAQEGTLAAISICLQAAQAATKAKVSDAPWRQLSGACCCKLLQ
jgi:hypothetical protein